MVTTGCHNDTTRTEHPDCYGKFLQLENVSLAEEHIVTGTKGRETQAAMHVPFWVAAKYAITNIP